MDEEFHRAATDVEGFEWVEEGGGDGRRLKVLPPFVVIFPSSKTPAAVLLCREAGGGLGFELGWGVACFVALPSYLWRSFSPGLAA